MNKRDKERGRKPRSNREDEDMAQVKIKKVSTGSSKECAEKFARNVVPTIKRITISELMG